MNVEFPLGVFEVNGARLRLTICVQGVPERDTPILELLKLACERHGVTVEDVFSTSRARSITRVRILVSHLLLTMFDKSVAEVARALDRDHTTVLFYRERARTLLTTDPTFRTHAEELGELLRPLPAPAPSPDPGTGT